MSKRLFVGAIVVVLVCAVPLTLKLLYSTREQPRPGAGARTLEEETRVFARYAGSESCRNCHPEAFELWANSNHGLAERKPDPRLDEAAFVPPRSFKHGTQETATRAEGSNYFVNCVGLSGTNEAFRVARVIGNFPLRQFLVEFPGGRLQTLEASYDPRTNDWFDVYGEEDRRPGEWGHWTGRGMNWNSMCAACHNTRLRKNYNEAADTYHTRMAEMTVGCEACHGPLKAHNEWQMKHGKTGDVDPTVPRFTRRQILDNCGSCHARRADLTGDFKPGDAFFDHQSLAIVDRSDVYYPDGQVRDENYEFAAFLGSRMHAKGVICLDCHNPHSMKTRLPGNWLCLNCHGGGNTNAPTIDPVAHSHHKVFGYSPEGKLVNTDLMAYQGGQVKETGGECVNCHMPQTVYMQRHWRHDHGFTIPDPLLTKEHGIPNACNRCHADKSVDWALETCAKWFGEKMERPARKRAQWIALARAGNLAARDPLLALLEAEESPYWRGVIAGMLGQWVSEPPVRDALLKRLGDADPLPREQAVRALEPWAADGRGAAVQTIRGLLQDPIRSVRVAAAWALRGQVDSNSPAAGDLALWLDTNADQPTGQMQKGALALARGDTAQAVVHYEKAVAWDPNSAPIRHDLAVALSSLGRTEDAVRQLEAACRLDPKEAEYPYKLGLALSEAGAIQKAAAALEQAVKVDPRHGRAWYNLGLAQRAIGQPQRALEALQRAEELMPREPQAPYARATILAAQGRHAEARSAAERALEINPGHADALRLLEDLSRK